MPPRRTGSFLAPITTAEGLGIGRHRRVTRFEDFHLVPNDALPLPRSSHCACRAPAPAKCSMAECEWLGSRPWALCGRRHHWMATAWIFPSTHVWPEKSSLAPAWSLPDSLTSIFSKFHHPGSAKQPKSRSRPCMRVSGVAGSEHRLAPTLPIRLPGPCWAHRATRN